MRTSPDNGLGGVKGYRCQFHYRQCQPAQDRLMPPTARLALRQGRAHANAANDCAHALPQACFPDIIGRHVQLHCAIRVHSPAKDNA